MKKLLATTSVATTYLAFAPFAFALDGTTVNPCPATGIGATLCSLTAGGVGGLVGGLLNAVFVIAIVIALAYLVYGGIRWIMSQGDKSKVQDARNHIVAAVLGLIIVFLSYFIITIILQVFGLGSIKDLNITPIKLQ